MSKLSFIVPVYKPKLDILSKCVKSIIEQSLKDWEIIFVLDGPEVYAKSAIASLMKKVPNHFKVVEIEHGGACNARNEGFKHAKGEIVIFWDCDCVIEPHAAKAWIDIFDNKKEVDFIYSGYKFLGEQGCINAEPFDPWLLRVNNYISTCFPLRREKVVKWNESLKSLQDWDFWLTVVENGGKGKFMNGYAFSTAVPDPDSISGKGCTNDNWLDRLDTVKKLHNIPNRDVCVTSLANQPDGLALAKYIEADYREIPNYKPHRYTSIIQVGFSLNPARVETHCGIFRDKNVRKFIFWQPDDIFEIYNRISFLALSKYAILLNDTVTQFVEDETAREMMVKAGFKVSILPMPMHNDKGLVPQPIEHKFAVDIDPGYSDVFKIIDKSLPDIRLEILDGVKSINDYTGLIHFFGDRTLSNAIKRTELSGRHIISNVKGHGFIDDSTSPDMFIKNLVNKVRELAHTSARVNEDFKAEIDKSRLLEVLK